MSVTVINAVDKLLNAVEQDISSAIEKLSRLVVNKDHGYDDMTDGFRNQIKETFYTLIKLRDEWSDFT